MNAKSKAEDLILKYSLLKDGHNHLVKQCATISVDEMIKEINRLDNKFNLKLDGTIQYWNEVKKEIELL